MNNWKNWLPRFNQMGAAGWELVSLTISKDLGYGLGPFAIYKREVQMAPPAPAGQV